MGLFRDEEKFDRNGDGRLSPTEWFSWYLDTYGADIETKERRRRAQWETHWNNWQRRNTVGLRNMTDRILHAAAEVLPLPEEEAKTLAWKALLHQCTAALIAGNSWNITDVSRTPVVVGDRTYWPYRGVGYNLVDWCNVADRRDLEQAMRKRTPLFPEAGQLTAEICGAFWQQLIAQLPPCNIAEEDICFRDGGWLPFPPDTDEALVENAETCVNDILRLYVFFEDKQQASVNRSNCMLEYFVRHWRAAQGVYVAPPDFYDAEVERLAAEIPQLSEHWTAEELARMDLGDLLEQWYSIDPEQAIALLRARAGTTEPLEDPEEAEKFSNLLQSLVNCGSDRPELLRPLLCALGEDEDFARQVFQSACVAAVPWDLIDAARKCEEYDLMAHFLELLFENPLPREQWEVPPEAWILTQVFEALYAKAPERAIALWRASAGTAEPLDDSEAAEEFISEFASVLPEDNDDAQTLRPLLCALREDDTFARQVFQSAWVNYFHWVLIDAARRCGMCDLAAHFLDLLLENPLPRVQWEVSAETWILAWLFEELYAKAPERAIALWRACAGTAEPLRDPEAAEEFVLEFSSVLRGSSDDAQTLRPLLCALRENAFAQQVFQSACVGSFQWDLIDLARRCGECDLAVHFLDLLWENPLPRAQWEVPLNRRILPGLLKELYPKEPERAIALWRAAIGTDAPLTDPTAAQNMVFMMQWVINRGANDPPSLRPLLCALREETLARQVFQSATVDGFQRKLIRAAHDCGERDLAEHFLDLLFENPLPQERWEIRPKWFEQLRDSCVRQERPAAAPAAQPPAAVRSTAEKTPQPSSGEDHVTYCYCMVKVDGCSRPLAYLAGELPVKAGDRVCVPYGRDNAARHGQVLSVDAHTRASAPWPPEQTKAVLAIANEADDSSATLT